ncbi:MAG TPA: TIGR03667 family PPOX class F420-dependent oxidoreductase [Actinopolymorphaceae bacterium]|nr:TIGR03667 family PPOX class F420-dependent oxidoreductase [Actinopolymorphaceae bacterium]
MLTLDTTTEFGAHVVARLQQDPLIWLVTVNADGTPQPTLVWYLWTGTDIIVFSQPDKPKLHNIARNPRVALHLESNGQGGDVVVLTGGAQIDPAGPSTAEDAAYEPKYAERITRMGLTYDEFTRAYSVTIRIVPEKLRGWR